MLQPLKPWHCATLLAIGAAGLPGPGRAQVAAAGHWQLKPGTLVYLDGKPSSAAALQQLDNEAIAVAEGMMGQPLVRRSLGDATATEAVVVTTKANAGTPAVLAFADRAHLMSAFTYQPASVRDIAPPALAYITSHYPDRWLGGEVLAMTRKSTGAVKYRVQLAGNWGFRYVSFTAAGDFVDEGAY